MPPYVRPCSLVLSRIPTCHTGILMLVQLPTIQTTHYTGAGSRCLPCNSLRCAGSQQFKRFLMLVQASDNSDANPEACAGSLQFKKFLMPVQVLDNSHANAYACAGSKNSKNALCLCRLPTIHTRFLMLVKVPNNSNDSLC
ncbi:hypothetical protein O181_108837 [Austropuccinia psidii MF-1]|uniref:Uncharacterized protein n=1 Tax=Austropuccinia psidii MF-1 TaxID=1389203 RepID=A0A9Q3PQT5_9BASI|nr:hypothetical protein [Austropuccinia psidii MF-1]